MLKNLAEITVFVVVLAAFSGCQSMGGTHKQSSWPLHKKQTPAASSLAIASAKPEQVTKKKFTPSEPAADYGEPVGAILYSEPAKTGSFRASAEAGLYGAPVRYQSSPSSTTCTSGCCRSAR